MVSSWRENMYRVLACILPFRYIMRFFLLPSSVAFQRMMFLHCLGGILMTRFDDSVRNL